MRRSFLLLLAVSILPLGCGENMGAKESREARADFQRVVNMVQEVRKSYLPSEKGLETLGTHKSAAIDYTDPALKAAMKTGTVADYHAALIGQAEKQLKTLITRGQTSQKVAAHQLLASLYIASAGYDHRAAMNVSDNLAEQGSKIEMFLTSVERSSSMIGRFIGDDKPVVDKWTVNQEEIAGVLSKTKAEDNKLTDEIDALQSQIDALTKTRDEAFKKASAFRAEAFPKKGEEQYELYIKAIDSEREAQTANTKIEDLTVSLNLAKSKKAIVSRELQLATDWSQTLALGISDAGKRTSAFADFEQKIVAERKAVAAQLAADFASLSDLYEKAVASKLDGALKKVTDAVDTLAKAQSMAVGDERVTNRFESLEALVAKLNIEADSVVAANRYLTTAQQVKNRAAAVLPEAAATVNAAIEATTTKLNALIDSSRKTVADLNAVLADPQVTSVKDNDALGQARIARVATARKLANDHIARLAIHGGPAAAGGSDTAPESSN